MSPADELFPLAVSRLGWSAERVSRASASELREAAEMLGLPIPPDLPTPEPIWPGALEIALFSAVFTLLGFCVLASYSV